MARSLRGIIRRPEQSLLAIQQRSEIILLPDMVPAGYHMNPQGKELVHQLCRKAEAIGGIFTVDYDHISTVILHQGVQSDKKSPASGLSADIPKQQGDTCFCISHEQPT